MLWIVWSSILCHFRILPVVINVGHSMNCILDFVIHDGIHKHCHWVLCENLKLEFQFQFKPLMSLTFSTIQLWIASWCSRKNTKIFNKLKLRFSRLIIKILPNNNKNYLIVKFGKRNFFWTSLSMLEDIQYQALLGLLLTLLFGDVPGWKLT